MLTSRTKKRLALSLAVTTTLGASLLAGSASADPKQFDAFVGVGSDTTQDVNNAFAGFTGGINYTPVNTGAATGFKQLISFDASVPAGVSDTCITTKLGGSTFTRPNGSTGGRKALYAASGLSAAGWTGVAIAGSPVCATAVDISGAVDYARSSAGPASGDIGTDLTYIPFGRDGMSFAYYRANGAPVTTLTRAELTTLFTTGPTTIGGVRIVPCGIQTSSGTFAFWNTVTTATTAQENTATALCNGLGQPGLGGRAQESDALGLKLRGDALAAIPAEVNTQVVIGFSAGSFIAQGNSVAPGTVPSSVNVGIGSISNNGSGVNLGAPVAGASGSLTPVSTFFSDTVFGRNVYTVLPTTVATGPGNAAIKAMFVGPTAAVCGATATLNTFGFLANANCGSTALRGSWITGAS